METNNKEIKRRSTFSLLFYINRTKVRKDGTCKLLCKVSIDAKSAPININAFVDPSLWNPETKRANGRSENARTVNLAIEKLTEKITGHYRHIRKSLGFVTAELVKNAVEGIGQKPFTLLALFREHNEEFRKRVGVDRKEETYESYENSYNILASFVKKRKEKEDVALRSLDREFYDDFEIFLRTDREMKPKTVHEHLYRLKKMTKRAVSQGTLRRDPYGKLHPELPRRKSRHLKLEDLKKLMETPVDKPNLQRVRDWFLFATFTGLSYADLKRLSEKDITQSDDGTYWIHIRRQKTETPSAIRLLNVPLHPSVEIFLVQKHGLLLWLVLAPHGTLLQHTADFREGIIQLPVDGRIGDHVIRAEALKGTPADTQVTADLLAVHPFVVYILLIPCTPLFRERGDCSLYFLYTPDKLVIGSRTDHYDFHTPLFFSLLQRSGLYGQLKTRSVRLFF